MNPPTRAPRHDRHRPTRKAGSANRRWRAIAGNLVIVVILLAAGLYIESHKDAPAHSSRCDLIDAQDSSPAEEEIAHLALAGPRDLRSRRVTVVALREDSDPSVIFANLCEQRWYLAQLIDSLTALGASEIVVDKFFNPRSCPSGDPNTAALIAAVQRTPLPVIVGRATHPPGAGDSTQACLILSDSLDFGYKLDNGGHPTSSPAVLWGLTRLNSDIQKIPLSWSCYATDEAFRSQQAPLDKRVQTISWIASVTADSGLAEDSRLTKLLNDGRHPFTPFIRSSSMSSVSALSILCGSSSRSLIESRYQVDCGQHPLQGVNLRQQIVVIGEDVEGTDRHVLFGEGVPGVFLQANYIESLLDDYFMKGIDPVWDYVGLLVWLVFLYIVFWFQPELALIASILGFLLLRYVVVEIAIYTGFYPRFGVMDIGAIAIALKYIETRGHLSFDAMKDRLEERRRRAPRTKPST